MSDIHGQDKWTHHEWEGAADPSVSYDIQNETRMVNYPLAEPAAEERSTALDYRQGSAPRALAETLGAYSKGSLRHVIRS